jgi:hypothetical protein
MSLRTLFFSACTPACKDRREVLTADIFKNDLSKKGVDYFLLSNDTNKSIANFRETIPLSEL